ncbi:MAG: HAD-IA family hydrolase [Alcanivorax sp.]|jgi:phosphoglycolate phosphatase|uniref:HAD superfamily hydrolase n=2 Tax=Alloalcanivorax venustensis TaxID=172371 RepID=A0ABS0AJN4_9GAMM|nr:HAD-IA family hydrolase [Alloalcanivorax venustensis]KXJ42474.1 MAG: HAD family hydrolase [Alcanivorax sp. Nap_24]MBA4730691.1 HAD-IA family hydrolase [Alcanivorax sp.]MEC8880719.1 HAD-IA family hydrolase [Pseudomonadota bacterium]SMO70718.1 phosphoglycolate phosphatase [Alcanivorax sp. DSM 26295]MBD3651127.1 HAD-IA family hydrolase [Alcanivorax sp.]|tara:strand:+ start:3458 stop:4135 length:678 start_codon:yes stop_codon:yes gene_type:complete
MAYQLVIFDWDGTVMDSTGRIIACMHQAGADLCLPVLEDDAVREIIGLGLPEALRTLYPGIGDRDLERMRERYAVHFVAAEASPSRLYPGARETLAALRAAGLRLAVATGKSRKGLDRVWASSGLGDSFDASRCADETHSKPHPAMVTELLTELGVAPERALVVGDTSFDLQMARDAGVDRVAVSYGAHPVDRLMNFHPLAVIDALPQLLPLLGVDCETHFEETV